jgi:diguanylate cyclase (GGDEF)-like protein
VATILVVDDRPANRQFVLSLLGYFGHRLLEAAGGAEALQVVRDERPDLVVTDIGMQGMDGYQFALRLRADPQVSPPRIIFLTATFFEAEARALAQACGVSRYITRPVEPQVLLEAIDAVLAEPAPPPGERLRSDEKLIDRYMRLMAAKLRRHTSGLEILNNTRSRERTPERTARLESANAGLQAEIARRQQAEEALRHANIRLSEQVVRDPLTGLFNRRYLEESLEREVARAKRSGTPLGVMMIDIDHFKHVNDSFGHAAGDAVLEAVSRSMQSMTRVEDILCRYGGEEFVLVMTAASLDTIRERAEMLREGVRQLKIEFDGRHVGHVTISIGIAVHPDHGETGSQAMEAADTALYRAKQSGRNRTMIASAARG